MGPPKNKSKTVLITGCSDGGIGSALGLVFQSKGFHVYATARNLSKVSYLAKLPNVTVLELDVNDFTHIKEAVEAVSKDTGGTLDILVNNSGRNYFMPILDSKIEDSKKIFDTNFWGPLEIIQNFAPLLIKAKGTIVNITSISGYVNVPWMGIYAGSKSSLHLMSETLRLELQPFGVNVLSVTTGAVSTNGQGYFEDFELPEDSLYKSVEKTIGSRARGESDGVKRTDLKAYATKVVNDILSGTTGQVWRGNMAGSMSYVTKFAPSSLMDGLVSKGTGVDEMLKNKSAS